MIFRRRAWPDGAKRWSLLPAMRGTLPWKFRRYLRNHTALCDLIRVSHLRWNIFFAKIVNC